MHLNRYQVLKKGPKKVEKKIQEKPLEASELLNVGLLKLRFDFIIKINPNETNKKNYCLLIIV